MSTRRIDALLSEYSESHQNPKNKLFHWFCIPPIFISLFAFLMLIPLPLVGNVAVVVAVLGLVYFLRLSIPLGLGFVVVLALTFYINHRLLVTLGTATFLKVAIATFVLAWIGQFVGHKIEGKKPSFFKDIQFLLIGPSWILATVFKKLGIAY